MPEDIIKVLIRKAGLRHSRSAACRQAKVRGETGQLSTECHLGLSVAIKGR